MAKKAAKTAPKGKAAKGKPKAATTRTRPAKKSKVDDRKAGGARAAKSVRRPALTRAQEDALLGPKAFPAEQLRQFKEMILQKRKETMEELDTLKESMMDVTTGEYISESSNYSLHMEQGTDAMEREKTFLFASRGSKFLNQLDDALVRIENGSYGQCKVCGLLIDKERLEAVPTAQTCAEYKNTNTPCERGRIALARRRQAGKAE